MNIAHKITEKFPDVIQGVSIGKIDDKATWRFDFRPDVGDEQRLSVEMWVARLDIDAETAAARITAAKAKVVAFADAFAERLAGAVPVAEKLGWDRKEQAARAHLSGTATKAQLAMLQTEIDVAGGLDHGLDDLAEKIITKAEIYAVAVARVTGIRRRTMAALDALGTNATQADIDVTLTAARFDAEAALADLKAR